MSSSKTAGVLISEMKMLRSGGQSGIFSVVEGPDDLRFWKLYLRTPTENIIVSEGVHNLQGCMRELPVGLAGSVIAIADKDYSEYLNPNPFSGCQDTFFYDEGFLESFLINSIALRKIIDFHSCEKRVARFAANNPGMTIFSYARKTAAAFGRLRILNAQNGFGICFSKKFSPYKYICPSTWSLDETKLHQDFAAAVGWTAHELATQLGNSSKGSDLQLSHGHDLVKVLIIGLRAPLGTAQVGEDLVAKELAIAFEKTSLKYKRLYRSMKAWAGTRILV